MKNYFQKSKEHPYHISVGVVLQNKEGQVACSYFKEISWPEEGSYNDFYTLMRETLEPNETIEQALHRGLMEEFGATAELKSFLGSIVCNVPHDDFMFQKNTLYFLFDLIDIDESRVSEHDKKMGAEIKWVDKNELITKMKEQGERLGREDFDESVVLERVE